ncbi:hypothetical protein B0J11DRAFT_217459 [Dendryphion nanum]|uniref:Uncharacterized protein n=1 Tax=Dendryphion nanum TaxID=256645 RepID=A0A9P9IR62_9PLEO|nr:hypothetical protein B0J11DRAFT_217459 [Dendryphion nanum]
MFVLFLITMSQFPQFPQSVTRDKNSREWVCVPGFGPVQTVYAAHMKGRPQMLTAESMGDDDKTTKARICSPRMQVSAAWNPCRSVENCSMELVPDRCQDRQTRRDTGLIDHNPRSSALTVSSCRHLNARLICFVSSDQECDWRGGKGAVPLVRGGYGAKSTVRLKRLIGKFTMVATTERVDLAWPGLAFEQLWKAFERRHVDPQFLNRQ